MGDITGRSITRRQVSLSRPACAPEALLGRSNIGQGKCRDTERICFTAVPAVCEVASCYEHVWGGRTCPGVLIVAGPPFFSEKCSFLAALTYLSFSHCETETISATSANCDPSLLTGTNTHAHSFANQPSLQTQRSNLQTGLPNSTICRLKAAYLQTFLEIVWKHYERMAEVHGHLP